ncbi:hypothetical protein C8Q73DRAFT_92357 [Cubamyces lactineus]|nr:hypothetical protein C8Q73DRAFT_92357 [Cubamyces lactineus]
MATLSLSMILMFATRGHVHVVRGPAELLRIGIVQQHVIAVHESDMLVLSILNSGFSSGLVRKSGITYRPLIFTQARRRPLRSWFAVSRVGVYVFASRLSQGQSPAHRHQNLAVTQSHSLTHSCLRSSIMDTAAVLNGPTAYSHTHDGGHLATHEKPNGERYD